jgi:hypothetical protein
MRDVRRSLFQMHEDTLHVKYMTHPCPMLGARLLFSLTCNIGILSGLVDALMKCFLPALFKEHMRHVIQIDGAGMRCDAEFKMAKFITQKQKLPKGRWQTLHPFECLLAVRGARGLYLDCLRPQQTMEKGSAYIALLDPICAIRPELCMGACDDGCPDFVVFDHAPTYELYALAVIGKHWPRQLFALTAPPVASVIDSRLSPLLRRNAVTVASDPPHRLWDLMRCMQNHHPDFYAAKESARFLLNRISAPQRTLLPAEMVLEPRTRVHGDEEALLKVLAAARGQDDMKSIVRSASAKACSGLKKLLWCANVRDHPAFERVLQATPPGFRARPPS